MSWVFRRLSGGRCFNADSYGLTLTYADWYGLRRTGGLYGQNSRGRKEKFEIYKNRARVCPIFCRRAQLTPLEKFFLTGLTR